ncbi:MAG: helix-turn-helix transcriptional regulator [Candidatus Gastranaerophilales bacterium]|nr:helix-turn-helix transcriptional regulator [Candidatus Gastranaerophilales bacterium]
METLASFVQKTRDNLGMSAKGLALRANIDLSIIEDIEAGKDLFLPVTIRQKLAKALRCSLDDLLNLERGYQDIVISNDVITAIKQQILGGHTDIKCPKCGSQLVCRIAKMYDTEDNLVLEPKAHCSKCVFQLKD